MYPWKRGRVLSGLILYHHHSHRPLLVPASWPNQESLRREWGTLIKLVPWVFTENENLWRLNVKNKPCKQDDDHQRRKDRCFKCAGSMCQAEQVASMAATEEQGERVKRWGQNVVEGLKPGHNRRPHRSLKSPYCLFANLKRYVNGERRTMGRIRRIQIIISNVLRNVL